MSAAPTDYPDLFALPRNVNGPRATSYWGVVWLIVIEAVVILWLIVSYFYLRVESIPVWPPPGIDLPQPWLSGAATALLLISIGPVAWALHGMRQGGDKRPLRLGLPIALAMVAGYIVITLIDSADRDYTWATDAYGSIVWTITGYQLLHAIALLGFGGVVTYFGFAGRYDAESHRGLEAAALYWYFVAVAGLPAYATVYLAPYLL